MNSQFEISTRNIRQLVGHSHNNAEPMHRGGGVVRGPPNNYVSIDKIKHDDNNNNYYSHAAEKEHQH